MTIYSVHDPEFIPYGRVITGLEDAVSEILPALAQVPLPEGTGYVPTEPLLQDLPAADVMRDHCFGGMPLSGVPPGQRVQSKSSAFRRT